MKFILVLSFAFILYSEATIYNPYNPYTYNALQGQNGFGYGANPVNYNRPETRRRCPVCDPSVFTYCDDKLFHDSCCCNDRNNPYDDLPYQCNYADCSFLHANSCQEHELITGCCCIKK